MPSLDLTRTNIIANLWKDAKDLFLQKTFRVRILLLLVKYYFSNNIIFQTMSYLLDTDCALDGKVSRMGTM